MKNYVLYFFAISFASFLFSSCEEGVIDTSIPVTQKPIIFFTCSTYEEHTDIIDTVSVLVWVSETPYLGSGNWEAKHRNNCTDLIFARDPCFKGDTIMRISKKEGSNQYGANIFFQDSVLFTKKGEVSPSQRTKLPLPK